MARKAFFASSASAMVLCFDSRVEEEVHWGQGKSDTQEPFSFPVWPSEIVPVSLLFELWISLTEIYSSK